MTEEPIECDGCGASSWTVVLQHFTGSPPGVTRLECNDCGHEEEVSSTTSKVLSRLEGSDA